MKDLIKKLTLLSILPTFLLAGCTGGKNDPPTPKPKPEVHWTQEIDDYVKESLDDYYKDLPIFTEGEFFEGNVTEEDGTNYTTLYFDTELTIQMANMVYRTTCMSQGFDVSTLKSGLYQASKSVSLEYVLVVTYGTYKEKTNALNTFAIETFLYRDKITEWPTEEVESVLGCDIPHIEAPYYQFHKDVAEGGVEYFELDVFGLDDKAETTYMGILKEAGYVVRTGTSTCNAISHEDRVQLEFMYNEEYEVLAILGYELSAELTWPTQWVKQLLGNDAIPVYSDPAVTYWHGTTALEYGSMKTYNIIECSYAPRSAMSVYAQQMVNAGWERESDDASLPDDWPLFIWSAQNDYMARFNKGTHTVEVRYYDPDDPLTGANYELSYPFLMIIIYK